MVTKCFHSTLSSSLFFNWGANSYSTSRMPQLVMDRFGSLPTYCRNKSEISGFRTIKRLISHVRSEGSGSNPILLKAGSHSPNMANCAAAWALRRSVLLLSALSNRKAAFKASSSDVKIALRLSHGTRSDGTEIANRALSSALLLVNRCRYSAAKRGRSTSSVLLPA